MDFDKLVNEILGMAKQSAEERKGMGGNPNISWDNTPAGESYWKDIRSRNTQLEVGKQNEIGTMARQRLATEGAANVADITGRAHVAGEETMAGAHRYAADQKLEGDKYIAGAKDHPFSVWMKANPGADEETVKKMKKYFGTPDVKTEDVRSFDKTVAPDTITPPIRTNTSATSLPGAPSMDFPRTDLGPNRETLALAKKKSEDNLLYGTKPQSRSWLSAF
jgi:hypothetical protein